MSFLISLFLSLSWGFEPTTSAMQAFDKGLFHLLDSDASAEPELAEQYFTARLPNIIRTESETEFFRNTGLEPGILLKWAADYSQGRFKYINAVRLSFVLLHLDHSKKQIYIPKLLKNGLKENDANSLLCMALYEYRQPYSIQSIKNARDLLNKIPRLSQIPKDAMLMLVTHDIYLFETLPKLAFYWVSSVTTERVTIETSKLERIPFSKGIFAFLSGIKYILEGSNDQALRSFEKELSSSVDQRCAYSFLDDPYVHYTDEEKVLILGIVGSQPEHKDYKTALHKLARICFYQPYDHEYEFQSLGVKLLEFINLKGIDTKGDLNLYRFRSYLSVGDSSSLNLIDPAIQKLLVWKKRMLLHD